MRSYLSFTAIAIVIIALSFFFIHSPKRNESYWLWAGITGKDAPKGKDYYIYQGVIATIDNKTHYEHIGLYPHPIACSQCYLVYRFKDQPPNAKGVIQIFLADAKKWQRHHVPIRGLQIDYDSPTKKLKAYADYLREVRQALPSHYDLNITGLIDWAIDGDKTALDLISQHTSFIAYQLYNGRQYLKNIIFYTSALENYPHPFRVGMLQDPTTYPAMTSLQYNPNFNGIIYFIIKR